MGAKADVTDFGRRIPQGDMFKSVYDPDLDGVIAVAQTEADMKRSVYDANLDGVIAVAQTQADMMKSAYDPNDDKVIGIAQGGTGKTGATAAFDALAPTSLKGQLIVHDGTGSVSLGSGIHGHRLTTLLALPENLGWNPPGAKFTPRDASSSDWTHLTLNTDGAWHDLDCSLIVALGANMIYFRVVVQDSLIDRYILLRPKGHASNYCAMGAITIVQNHPAYGYVFVPCDSLQRCQYQASDISWDSISLTIIGWTIAG